MKRRPNWMRPRRSRRTDLQAAMKEDDQGSSLVWPFSIDIPGAGAVTDFGPRFAAVFSSVRIPVPALLCLIWTLLQAFPRSSLANNPAICHGRLEASPRQSFPSGFNDLFPFSFGATIAAFFLIDSTATRHLHPPLRWCGTTASLATCRAEGACAYPAAGSLRAVTGTRASDNSLRSFSSFMT